MFQRLLIGTLIVLLTGCATVHDQVPVVQYVEKPKLNLGPINKPEVDSKSTVWSYNPESNQVCTNKQGFDSMIDNLTLILNYQLQLKEQLDSIKQYYKEP